MEIWDDPIKSRDDEFEDEIDVDYCDEIETGEDEDTVLYNALIGWTIEDIIDNGWILSRKGEKKLVRVACNDLGMWLGLELKYDKHSNKFLYTDLARFIFDVEEYASREDNIDYMKDMPNVNTLIYTFQDISNNKEWNIGIETIAASDNKKMKQLMTTPEGRQTILNDTYVETDDEDKNSAQYKFDKMLAQHHLEIARYRRKGKDTTRLIKKQQKEIRPLQEAADAEFDKWYKENNDGDEFDANCLF